MSRRTPSLFRSILTGYAWITVLLAAGVSILVYTSFRSAFRERALEDLTRSAYALVPAVRISISDSTGSLLNSLATEAASSMGTRVTVIAQNGSVLADSEKDPESMENHRTRVEVVAAFNGVPGRSVRFSRTLGRDMLYTAVPVVCGDTVTAVVRTSLFFDSYSAALGSIVNRILLIVLVVMAAAVFSGWLISRRIARPMSDLADVADRVRRGELGARAAPGHTREHNSLAFSLNETLARNQQLISDLTLSNNRSSAILKSMIEGVAVISSDRSVLLLNDSFRELFNRQDTETVLSPEVADLFSDEQPASAGTIEYSGRIIAYSRAEVESSGDSVFSFRDVTGEMRLSAMKKSFVANVSHELRTPLTAIKGYAETLKDDAEGDAGGYLEIILRNTDRLIALVKDIQTLSEVENGSGSLKIEKVFVAEILETVVPLFRQRAENRHIALKVASATEMLAVNADRYRIEQVFVNLIDNALKYTQSGSVEIRICSQNDLAVFTVSDTGCGIPSEAIPRLFERFFVVNRSRSRKLGGTGLGLAITKHIIEAHGGTVSVSSIPGEGSVFRFTLPLA
jgi:two-component system phosphate regulon sensor histidine kinase PhoR